MRTWLTVVLGTSLVVASLMAQRGPAPRPPVPHDAIPVIVDAFRTHSIVGLSAGVTSHRDERGEAFAVSLVRDPRAAAAFNDLVVEGASGRYQDAMDRYVRGEAVPDSELRHVWDDTTQPQFPGPIWTGQPRPIYRAVREVNTSLPRQRQFRILLGDPPIDWENVHTPDDYMKWLEQRDSYPAGLIRREVLDKGRRALVLFAGGHLQRKNQAANYQMDLPQAQTIVSLLEAAGTRTFVIRTAGGETTPAAGMDRWPVPSIALLRGTTLGASDEPASSMPRSAIRDGRLVPVPREQWSALRLEDQIDAVLYLGPGPAKEPVIPRTICADRTYIETRLKRMALGALPAIGAKRLKEFCGM